MTEVEGFEIVWQLATQCFVPAFIIILGLIALGYFKTGQPVTAVTFLGFGIVLAAGEGASIYFTHKTISENHWFMSAVDSDAGVIQFFLILALFLVIAVHLGKVTIAAWRSKDKT